MALLTGESRVIGEKRIGGVRTRIANGIQILEETYVFTVEAASKDLSRIEVALTPGLPISGITQSAYGLTTCKSKSGERNENNPKIWEFTCEFSSEVEENQQQSDEPPEEWIPIYQTKFERLQEVVTKDIEGDPIVNSTGAPYPTGLTLFRFIPVWEFFQFEPATVNDETIIARNETVNSGVFKGRAAKTLLLTVVDSKIGFYYGRRLRLTVYSLKYNSKNWRHKRLDIGRSYIDTGQRLAYLDDDGNVIDGPLDGSGNKASVGSGPAVNEFDVFASSDFSFLRI